MGDDLVRIREKRRCLTERIDKQRRSRERLLQKLRDLGPHFAAVQDLCEKHSVPDLIDLQRSLRSPRPAQENPREKDSEVGSSAEVVKELVANCLLWVATPIDSTSLARRLPSELDRRVENGGLVHAVEAALKALAAGSTSVEIDSQPDGRVVVLMVDKLKLWEQLHYMQASPGTFWTPPMLPGPASTYLSYPSSWKDEADRDLNSLLSRRSFLETQKSKTGEELLDLIHRPTAKENAVAAKFRTKGGSTLQEYCPDLTKEDCRYRRGSFIACEKMHFRRILSPHTDVKLGDCSFLDTCRHLKTCKYVHYELDDSADMPGVVSPVKPLSKPRADYCSELELGEPQWINCDIRSFKMEVLGQFGVIMADPPWDIHMELPYGTMSDDEMRGLNVPVLQTDGLIFLWVTGRAMELGRECLELWGYRRLEELIWVKTNQLQRIIRTGRTGHWLNHSKEHCLVGIKGNPEVNRNLDTDVIVAEVRETSRKPDEMYPMLERLSPRTRKLELFARMHNTHAGWISLGNQLSGVRLVEEGLRSRFKATYPGVEIDSPTKD